MVMCPPSLDSGIQCSPVQTSAAAPSPVPGPSAQMGAPATASPWPILTTPSAGRCGIARAAATKSLTTSSFSRPRRARVASTEKLQCRLVRLISSPRMGEATASAPWRGFALWGIRER